MPKLIIDVDIDLNNLSEKYLPYVSWENVSFKDMNSLSSNKIKYISTRELILCYGKSTATKMCDEDILSVIARDVSELGIKYDFHQDNHLSSFLQNFCTFEFLSMYYKQIHSLFLLNDAALNSHSHNLLSVYGLYPVQTLCDKSFSTIKWVTLSSKRVPIEHRFDLLKSGAFWGYTLHYNADIVATVPVLYTRHLNALGVFDNNVPDVFDSYAIDTIYGFLELFGTEGQVTWDELIDKYYSGEINMDHLESAWYYFLCNQESDVDDLQKRIESKLPTRSKFSAEDFL